MSLGNRPTAFAAIAMEVPQRFRSVLYGWISRVVCRNSQNLLKGKQMGSFLLLVVHGLILHRYSQAYNIYIYIVYIYICYIIYSIYDITLPYEVIQIESIRGDLLCCKLDASGELKRCSLTSHVPFHRSDLCIEHRPPIFVGAEGKIVNAMWYVWFSTCLWTDSH